MHTERTPADVIARAIGYAVNPLLFPPLAAAMVLAHFGAPTDEILRVAGLFLLFFGFAPLAHLLWLRRRRRIASLEVVDRRRRYQPLAAALGLHLIALPIIPAVGQTAWRLITALLICQLATTGLIAAITLRWKISVHTAAAAGFVGVLLFFSMRDLPRLDDPAAMVHAQPGLALWLFPLILLVMWARVRARVHSPLQVLAGATLGFAVSLLILALLQRMDVLTA